MQTKRVQVLPYSEQWAAEFLRLREHLAAALGAAALRIEHVGSTSVEGLAAKPILDVDVVIKDAAAFTGVKRLLEQAGYRHEGDLGIVGREAFRYDDPRGFMAHHLYVCAQDAAELHRHLTFRNYLRAHPRERDGYAAVKLSAAARFPEDIDGYMAAKAPCITEIYKKCGLI